MFLFDLYRRLLLIACTSYVAVRTVRGILGWIDRLSGPHPLKRVARGYLGAMLASIRPRRFRADLAQIAVLLAVLGVILAVHGWID